MNFLEVLTIPKDDAVAFTFFTGYMAMLAASIFFFFGCGKTHLKTFILQRAQFLVEHPVCFHVDPMEFFQQNYGTPEWLRLYLYCRNKKTRYSLSLFSIISYVGEMAERFKAQHWNCYVDFCLPRVRIPLFPFLLIHQR